MNRIPVSTIFPETTTLRNLFVRRSKKAFM